jgi:hypothetical protein
MKLKISNDRKIADIQNEFTGFFPFLKLDFFGGGSEFSTDPVRKSMIITKHSVGELKKITKSGEITLFPEMSVSDLETIFNESFGLSVHILRKAGNIWLETSHSDTWSLEEQNRQGEKISAHLIKQKEERKRL